MVFCHKRTPVHRHKQPQVGEWRPRKVAGGVVCPFVRYPLFYRPLVRSQIIMRNIAAFVALVAAFPLAAQFVPNGPDAPDVVVAFDTELMQFSFTLSNTPASNNYVEGYVEWTDDATPDPYWRFQGYAVYQLRSPLDADDSLALVIHDPARALPVILVDKADTISSMLDNVYTAALDSCTPVTFVLDNAGLSGDYSNSFDPFTFLGYDPGGIYCFVAVAFAYNPYHERCDTLQQVLHSKRSPSGALQSYCIDLARVGMAEQEVASVVIAPVPASSSFTLRGPAGARYGLRCMSALGTVVMEGTVVSGEAIDVSDKAPGLYHIMLTDQRGHTICRNLVVER